MTAFALDPRTGFGAVTRDYLALSKYRIVMMLLITTAAGYLFGADSINGLVLFHALVGTALVAGGTNALNQYIEREHDAKMHRTRMRPLPAGRITPRNALVFSAGIAVLGTIYLALLVNWLTAALGVLTLLSYIFVYTPLKRISSIATLIGALPGAMPPLMGWTAATNELALGGLLIFGIQFFWQLPHFMAISWMYREDYSRGGFAMLACRDANGVRVARQAVVYMLVLFAVSLGPWVFGLSGLVYLAGASFAGAALFALTLRFSIDRRSTNARSVFIFSNLYLMAVMFLLVLNARP